LPRPGFEPPAQQQPFLTGGLTLALGVWTALFLTRFMAISFSSISSWLGEHKQKPPIADLKTKTRELERRYTPPPR
tara:strand:+ start:2886 stop:3113 length:228 start_codon:yes stop_codon:yes gene_type:complete